MSTSGIDFRLKLTKLPLDNNRSALCNGKQISNMGGFQYFLYQPMLWLSVQNKGLAVVVVVFLRYLLVFFSFLMLLIYLTFQFQCMCFPIFWRFLVVLNLSFSLELFVFYFKLSTFFLFSNQFVAYWIHTFLVIQETLCH